MVIFEMPHHCCVPRCVSNTKKQAVVNGRSVSFHSFPSDPKLVKDWIVKIRRDVNDDFQVNKHTKVCSLHFSEDSFYSGTHKRTPAAGNTTSQSRSRLRPDAVPTIFEWSSAKRKPPAERSAVFVPVKRRRREVETEKTEQSADKEADERGDKESQSLASAREGDSLSSSDSTRGTHDKEADERGDKESQSLASTREGDSLSSSDSTSGTHDKEADERGDKESQSLASAREGDSLSSSDSLSGRREHEHCDCVEELTGQIDLLKTEKEKLEMECQSLRDVNQKLSSLHSHVFSIDRIKADNKLISFYTGFSSFLVFLSCFNFLRRSAEVMRVWKASATTPEDVVRVGLKPGPKQKLPLMEQFFLVMVRLRQGLNVVDIADRFKVHPTTVSRIFTTWINLMYFKFQELPVWLSRRAINHLMPPCFKQWFPTTRVIIDCTEFFINTPSSLARQSATWSAYKSHNTVKCLIGIAPHGHVTFVSSVFEGSISDRAITEQSGLLEKLDRGDSVMAGKGFDIQDLLVTRGVRLNIPPFKKGDQQMHPQDVAKTKKIAAVRIHVERNMQRIKLYKIIGGEIDNSMFDLIEPLVFVCAMLTNFQSPLVA